VERHAGRARRAPPDRGQVVAESLLGSVPLFRRLQPDQLAAVESAATVAAFLGGETLLQQGQIGQALYFVLSGALEGRTTPADGSAPTTRELARGDYFGEMAVLEPAPSPATYVVTRPSRLLVLTQVSLTQQMRKDPELAIAVAREAGRRARWTNASPEADELRLLRQQMLVYAGDLKKVYDEERTRAAQLREALMDTVRVLMRAIESKDPRQVGHGSRVARYAQFLARELGWDEERAVQAAIGGLIHDVGQVGLRDSLVRKNGPLTRDEIAEMRQHPDLGARLLSGIKSLEPLLPYVRYHHESFDGTGYPDGLRGQHIPVEVAVADAFDELRAMSPPNDAGATERAIHDLRKLSNERLDPDLLGAFVNAYRAGRLVV
jgi:HD-GYP domain-containing protein (c-di-GMP phosphodiesterase class II)